MKTGTRRERVDLTAKTWRVVEVHLLYYFGADSGKRVRDMAQEGPRM
jgi:hypothetical protein